MKSGGIDNSKSSKANTKNKVSLDSWNCDVGTPEAANDLSAGSHPCFLQLSEDLQIRVWDTRTLIHPAECVSGGPNQIISCCLVGAGTGICGGNRGIFLFVSRF